MPDPDEDRQGRSTEITPATLRAKADRYRLIAKGLYNPEMEVKLRALAEESERQAEALERSQDPQEPPPG